MTTYSYQATDSSGNTKEGTIDAHSLQSAREAVLALGFEPLEIYESIEKEPAAPWSNPLAQPSVVPNIDLRSPEKAPPVIEPLQREPINEAPDTQAIYFPLLETLRLYAGWLLAWYCLVYAIGSYQHIKEIPFRVPYAQSLFLSPMVLSFTFAAYLFLILSGIYKSAGKRKLVGAILGLLGIAIFVLYRINVQ